MIPPLGDREVDDDIWRLFQGQRALRATHQSRVDDDDSPSQEREERDRERERERQEEEMDVDELESDCVSSYNPSRAGSPAPGSSARVQNASQTQSSSSQTPTLASSSASVARLDATRRVSLLERRESSGPYMTRRGSSQALRRNRRLAESGDAEAEVDLAGVCFDPSGEYIYAASTRGISEWRVRGAEQTWWSEFVWA